MGKMMKNVKLNSKSAPSRTNTTHVIGEARDIVNLANEQRFEIKEPNKSGKSTQDSDTSVSIRLPSSLLKDYNATRVYFFNFKNDKLFPHKGNRTNKFINSEIVSASIKDREVRNLSDPVVIEFKLTDKNYSRNGSCVYWDFKANSGYGGWSKDGCSLETIDDSRVRCRCTHLTNFGILVVSTIQHCRRKSL